MWDAVNEDWIEDSQVGWRSIRGLTNNGKVIFQQTGPEMTQVNVFLTFVPPAGTLGRLADYLAGDLFDKRLNEDLQHFARMVAEAPAGALDPMSSHYLFHQDSAVATHSTTATPSAFQLRPQSDSATCLPAHRPGQVIRCLRVSAPARDDQPPSACGAPGACVPRE